MVKYNVLIFFGLFVILVIGLASCLPPPDDDFNPEPIQVSGTGTGLMGSYFDTAGNFVGSRVDSQVNFYWEKDTSPMSGVPDDFFSVVWTGEIEAPLDGNYLFTVFGDDGVRVFVDNVNVLPSDAWSPWNSGQSESDRIFSSNSISLEKGKKYSFRIEFFDYDWNAGIQLNWSRPDGVIEVIPMMYLYPGSIVSNAPSGLPFDDTVISPPTPPSTECGNNILESGEDCDDGNDNGKVCTPPTGGSCTYCSLQCDIVTLSGQSPTQPDNTQRIIYSESYEDFPNPERGWYRETSNRNSYNYYANEGDRLQFKFVRLDEYRDVATLPSSVLTNLEADFEAARQAGLKLILRFAYNRPIPDGDDRDAPEHIIIAHLNQLRPLLMNHSDVVAIYQAGFVGKYGEWHASTNNLVSSASVRANIINTHLDSISSDRMLLIRYPYYISPLYPNVLTYQNSFANTRQARTGLYVDCIVANPSFGGTFTSDNDRAYSRSLTNFTVSGGETCHIGGLSSENDCTNSKLVLQTYHVDFLNSEYWTDILNKWKNQGCYNEISRRLGYRFVLSEGIYSESVTQGGKLFVNITIRNVGYGKLYNPRPLELVLIGSASPYRFVIQEDARKILPLAGQTRSIAREITLPTTIPKGTYQMYLGLPDGYESLKNNPRYSIRLANTGSIWDSSRGLNNLGASIQIT